MQELTTPPEGYDSVKGVGASADRESFFKVTRLLSVMSILSISLSVSYSAGLPTIFSLEKSVLLCCVVLCCVVLWVWL